MPEPTQPPPPVRNLYRAGFFPRLRRAWGDGFRAAAHAARHPGPALAASLRRDRDLFAALLRGGGRSVRRGLEHPVHRRWLLGLLALAGFLASFSWQRCGLRGCPDVERLAALQPGGASTVYDVRGNRIGELTPIRWEVVELDDLPGYVPEAFVAVEDQRFYRHHGVDWRRFLGTIARNLVPGGRSQGASTITMQVARNVFPDRLPAAERTIRRKLLEIRVAREIEGRYAKRQILQTYLNHIYFGEGVYGIESAARVYFGKHASQLRLSEAALLAGLPKAPTSYSPRRNLERSVARRNLVLGLMAAQGRITAEEARQARAAPVRLARWQPERRRLRASYFVEQVRRVVEEELGQEAYSGALRIHTTLDPRVQAAAEQQLERQLRAIENGAFGRFRGPRRAAFERGAAETPYLQGAAIVLETETGDVQALVGGRSFEESRFDRVMQGFRQPGSAFKPFVFAAAVGDGVAPTDTLRDDTLRRVLPRGEVWEPRNFDGRFRGPVTVRSALRNSINTVAVLLAERAGLGEVEAEARRMGIRSDIPELPSIAIGAAAVRPIDLVRAYTPFATLGRRVEPRWVTRVEDSAGRVVWEPRVRRRRVLDPAVAFVVTSLMRDVVDRGTGRRVRTTGFRGPAAGKTGTTNGATDAWFVGFTPELLGAVWIGFDRPRPIVANGSGGELAAPVWGRILRAAQRRVPEAWEPPPGVVERRVTVAGHRVIAPGCRARGATYEEYFLRRHVPPAVCPRGTAEREGGFRAWWQRRVASVRTRVGEWARETWADLWSEVRGLAGLPADPAPRPARRPRPPARGAPAARTERADTIVLPAPAAGDTLPSVEVDVDTLPAPPPRDTIRIPPAPPPEPEPADTLTLPPPPAPAQPPAQGWRSALARTMRGTTVSRGRDSR
ncbi:MAG TPA: PBP1A family penicillin-binding protein [Longimicrobiaceae bacterium]|nr:PBP1A family penicillin-binding protein [Longimicrobiaceae bacterium]